MKHARKARSVAKSFRYHFFRMKRELRVGIPEDERRGKEEKWKRILPAFARAAGFWGARRKLEGKGSCTVTVEISFS